MRLPSDPQVAAIMLYESLWPENATRHTAWGPNVSTKRNPLGLRPFNRRPDRFPEWSGRLAGGRLGLGGGAGFQAGAALMSSASSLRLDRHEGESALGESRAPYSHNRHDGAREDEIQQLRSAIDDLSRKLDEVLAKKGV